MINLGFHDAYRHIHGEKEGYTYWDYMRGAWQKNNGLRIDHFLVSNSLLNIVKTLILIKTQEEKKNLLITHLLKLN
jgi:exodeoxyribonuclease-3